MAQKVTVTVELNASFCVFSKKKKVVDFLVFRWREIVNCVKMTENYGSSIDYDDQQTNQGLLVWTANLKGCDFIAQFQSAFGRVYFFG